MWCYYNEIMQDQITLLDVCKLPDVQIHSKTSLFKHIISKQNPEMQKIRENIIKLSYTNKVIGVRGQEVGIISKRLPLKFKEENKPIKKKTASNEEIFVMSNYVPHQNFFAIPLPTVRKQKAMKDLENTGDKFLSIDTSRNSAISANEHFRSTTSLKARANSIAKLKLFAKKDQTKMDEANYRKSRESLDKRSSKEGSRDVKRSKTGFKAMSNRKSFSHLLKDVNYNQSIQPISHEDNVLYKKFQRLNEMAKAIRLYEESNRSFEGRYQDKEKQVSASAKN